MLFRETFAQLPLFVISTVGRNINRRESLRFLVANTPRNDKIQGLESRIWGKADKRKYTEQALNEREEFSSSLPAERELL